MIFQVILKISEEIRENLKKLYDQEKDSFDNLITICENYIV
jgi:hypothetical protein